MADTHRPIGTKLKKIAKKIIAAIMMIKVMITSGMMFLLW